MSTLDLTSDGGFVFDELNFWLFFAASAIIATIFIIISYKIGEKHTVMSVISAMIGAIGLFSCITAPIGYSLLNPEPQEKVQTVEKIQVWAENNYLVTLSDADAKKLDAGKVNYDANETETTKSGTIVNYYGDRTIVYLVKDKKVWKLFSNDKELPVVTEKSVQ